MKNLFSLQRPCWVVLGMVAGLLTITGCSGGNEATDAKGKADPAPKAEAQQPQKKSKITVGVYERGAVPASEGTLENNRWTKWINDNGPVEVTFIPIPRWESVQKFNTLFAGGNAPDLIMEYLADYKNELYAKKLVMPLDDLIEKNSTIYKDLLKKYPNLDKLGRKPDGKLYEVGTVSTRVTPNHAYYIRVDWLKKLNLEIPKTTEDLYKVAKAFTEQDPDGNGKKDTYGMSLSFVSGQVLDNMFQNVGWVVENGQLVRDWERLKAVTEFKKRLYDEGIVDKDFLVDTAGAKGEQDWVTGKLGIWGANNGTTKLGYQSYVTLKKNNPNAEIIPIELPKSPFGQFSSWIGAPARTLGMISATAKDPVAVVKFIDFMNSEPFVRALNYGIEGVHSKAGANGCPQFISDELAKQVTFASDFNMISSSSIYLDKCTDFKNTLDPSKPIDQEFSKFIDIAQDAYVSSDRPEPGFTHRSTLPATPADILLIETTTTKPISDLLAKAIVSGPTATVADAIEKAKATWKGAGGEKAEKWYKDWYVENKDKAFLTKDLYK
ncbi:extracellular solute-binding protein [Paenibacillus agricola]|uniref:Extracellular solute-binding protein n=1 Tax=Paenibacillus agricola TaxID=2716264 RepID=A0ABX0JDZ5_9BACL|nr:extracellular solute-binding protein [Paenibacillus agricola]NHN34148.1 extracellular solute-binding protein [Paenibacillus agricola]